jgi:hypothetical protein
MLALALTAGAAAPPALPHADHVFTIVLENEEYGDVMGNPSMPYLRRLIARYGLALNYYGVTHPSLPNYLALTGGSTFGLDGSDCSPAPDCHVAGRGTNIADQLEKAGTSWVAYMDAMPAPCTTTNSGTYAVRHDPFVYYDDIRTNQARCAAHVRPYAPASFQRSLRSGRVPAYVWISPDVCHDGHDSCSTNRAAQSDAWLAANVPPILASPAWRNDGVLFVLWDEGTTTGGADPNAQGGHIAALIATPRARPGYRSSLPYTHYSYLRTVEDLLGLPHLGNAAGHGIPSMASFFTAP